MLHYPSKCDTLFNVRIEIHSHARKHSITDAEIRTVINHYELRVSVESNLTDIDADDYLYVGRNSDNEPHIEVVADHIDPSAAVAFHAMMLRPVTVARYALDLFITPDYAPQRPYIGPRAEPLLPPATTASSPHKKEPS